MTERLWMLLIVMVGAIGILTGVVFQERNKVQSLEEERSACYDHREKLSFEASELNQQVIQLKEKQRDTERESRRSSAKLVAFEKSLEEMEDERTVWEDERDKYNFREKHLKQQLDDFRSQLKASELAANKDRNKVQSLEEERSVCSDQREKLSFEASELNQQVTQLKEKQRDTERESRRASGKLVALEESLEEMEDERTEWEDEREKYKIREKHLKQQLDDFRSQLKASESATNEEKSRRLKSESDVEALTKEVNKCKVQAITQTVLLATALSAAFGKAPMTGNANSRTHPMLIKEFKTQAALDSNEEINGFAKLNEEIFVITSDSNIIERFDSASLSRTSRLLLQVYENLQDIQPCNRSQSLYVIEEESTGKRFISNVDPYNRKILASWAVDSCICRLSVTEVCHILATCFEECKIIEYSSTGHFIQEIVLKPETGIVHPVFALKMVNGNFLVSYSGKNALSLSVVGVAIVNSAGDVLKSYSDPLKKPEMVIDMAIDRLGNVLVAEMTSGRVLLLSPDLEYERDIVSEEHGTRMIHAMLLDEVNGRIFVADSSFNVEDQHFENGRVLVFDMK